MRLDIFRGCKLLKASSVPSKALQTIVLPYFFNCQSCKFYFSVLSSASYPKYATNIHCKYIAEDLRRIRDIISAKTFNRPYREGITSLSRQKLDPYFFNCYGWKSCFTSTLDFYYFQCGSTFTARYLKACFLKN